MNHRKRSLRQKTTLFTNEDPWQTPVDLLGTVHCNEKAIFIFTKLANVGKTEMRTYVNKDDAAATALSVEDYPVDDAYFTIDELLSDYLADDQPVNAVNGGEQILDAPEDQDGDYIDHNPLLNANIVLHDDDIKSVFNFISRSAES
ncbi:hypothetical protein ACH5RR_026777 [Cinchona calisaya]|uniref:Uncharacterized protein n=1 Tax=Cinchona calisaya TaxID=153742 RepID=A0ABD2Z6U8_9GENT